jgi:TENA/THI-4/PQQC family
LLPVTQTIPEAAFLALAAGEGEALSRLHGFATALGLSNESLAAYEPQPGCQTYPHFVAWLALNGSRLDVAIAFLVNLDAWGSNCTRMRQALANRYKLAGDELGFFDYFATPSTSLREQITSVADAGLTAGDSATDARRAARLLQAYELLFWDSLAERDRSTL